MSSAKTLEKATRPQVTPDGLAKLGLHWGGPPAGGRDGGSGGSGERAEPRHTWQLGVWLMMAAVTMLFVGFTSAYLVRRGQADWIARPLPSLLWVNTAVLALSSVALEWGKARERREGPVGRAQGYTAAAVLGLGFVVGQLAAWRQAVAAGLYLQSNPHSSYYYVLTAVHGVHVLAASAWLGYVAVQLRRRRGGRLERELRGTADAAALFWHFMGALWVYIFALLAAL